MKALAANLVRTLLARAARSRRVAEALFGARFLPVSDGHYYFDITSLVLTRHLRSRIKPSDRVLDLGTGSTALVSLYLHREIGCELLAADINPVMVAMAMQAIRHNGAQLQAVQSDLLSRIDWPFNIVVFNPPYVATALGETLQLPEATRSQWDGGHDGTAVIARFLSQLAALSRPVVAYLGINSSHVARDLMRKRIADQPKLALCEEYRHGLLPVSVYAIGTSPGLRNGTIPAP
jgi:release factor glutamine methyltransferase